MKEQCTFSDNIHHYRIFGIAIFEIVLILITAYYTSNYLKTLDCCNQMDINILILYVIIALIIIGIIAHIVSGTNTMLNYYLGISDKPKLCR